MKFLGFRLRKTTNPKKQSNQSSQPPKHTVSDARNKIISKTRTQITDAREKLAQFGKHKDARLKLEQLRLKKVSIYCCSSSVNY